MRPTTTNNKLENIKRIALFVIPIALMGCTTPSMETQHLEAKTYLQQLEKESPEKAYIVDFVATQRATNCEAPYSKSELEKLAEFDAMVTVATALKTYVIDSEFPVFIHALKATMNCDSFVWVEDAQRYIGSSVKFKAGIDAVRGINQP